MCSKNFNKMFGLLLFCALLFLSETVKSERSLIITTKSGPVKGKLNRFEDIEYYSYEGIPYAENPTGKLRFKPPVPRQPWTHVLDATKYGAICLQIPLLLRIEETSEDCLNVNVYVPKSDSDKLLPVMVFLHGGALQIQSGRIDYLFGPQFLLDREIIFVSPNYRLGPFGFLSLDIEEASGNAGLKDVLLSLKWVKDNVKKFGGDPDRITISGHSSGSLIINYLMLMNQSDGLFNQAIMLSGSAFSPRSLNKHPKDISIVLAKELGIKTDNVYKILEELQEMDASKIIDAYYNMSKTHTSPLRLYAPFVPSTEVKSNHALFYEDPMESFRKNPLVRQKVPVLVGITAQESIIRIPYVFEHLAGVAEIEDNPEHLIPSNIEYPIGSERSKHLAKLLSETYFDKDLKNFTLTSLIEIMSDLQYAYGVNFWISRYKNSVDSNSLFLYVFDFLGDLNRSNFYFKADVVGCGHGDDLPYFFVANVTKSIYNSIDDRSQRMKDRMIDYITNFIYHGNPTPSDQNKELYWPDYGREQYYLLLNEIPTVEKFNSSPLYPKMQFWEKVYDEYYEYLDNGGEIQKKIIP